jgi:molybdopterin converting factor small subunit
VARVKINYFGLIQNMVDNREEEVDLPDEATVRELLWSLVQRYGDDFRSMILTPDWQLLVTTAIYLDDRDISEIDGIETKLRDGSTLNITVIAYVVVGG